MPEFMPAPAFPSNAQGNGVVVVEGLIDANGDVRSATAVRSTASGFNDSAVRTARSWRFQPARRGGQADPTYAYLVFGFRQPALGAAPRLYNRRQRA